MSGLKTIVLGCGSRGWRADAINVDAQPQTGVPNFVRDDFTEGIHGGPYELAVMEDVIEHLQFDKIGAVLDDVREHLAPAGRLLIKCPNLETIFGEYAGGRIDAVELARLIYGQQNGADFDCHHWGFVPGSLVALLSAHGFEVEKFELRVTDETGRMNNMRVVARRSR